MRILIADDDPIFLKVLNRLVSRLGEVDSAMNGKEAVAAVKMALDEHEPYGLISLDVTMPELDGIGALQVIRQLEVQGGIKEEDRVKIIIMSGHSDQKKMLAVEKAGCDAYIIKPFTRKDLFAELSKLGIEIS